jgi:hypothetical protein
LVAGKYLLINQPHTRARAAVFDVKSERESETFLSAHAPAGRLCARHGKVTKAARQEQKNGENLTPCSNPDKFPLVVFIRLGEKLYKLLLKRLPIKL